MEKDKHIKPADVCTVWREHRWIFLKLSADAALWLTLLHESISFMIFKKGVKSVSVGLALSMPLLMAIKRTPMSGGDDLGIETLLNIIPPKVANVLKDDSRRVICAG